MRPFEIIIARLEGGASKPFTSKDGTSVRARCPCCMGRNISKLIVTEQASSNVLIYCFAGCPPIDILSSIGLDFSDLFANQKRGKPTMAPLRHDPHTLTSMAAEIIEDAEFLLLLHAVQPVDGIAARLVEHAQQLAQIKEFLKKGEVK